MTSAPTFPAPSSDSDRTGGPRFADRMAQIETPLVENEPIARSTYRLRVAAATIAAAVVPGQFVMIRMAGTDAPLIGRAFAVWDVIAGSDGTPTYIDLIYLKKGTFTTALSAAPVGTRVVLWGPLGNGFDDTPVDRLIMTAGGIGQTPMLMLGKEASGLDRRGPMPGRRSGWAKSVELIYGARTAQLLAGVDAFTAAGWNVTLCTDDGSAGRHGRVPDVLSERLAGRGSESIRVVTCGPEIMMRRVAEVCQAACVAAQVSMETPMACGIGICFSCVAKVTQADGSWDYKRTCVEGPIFPAAQICWD